MDALNPNQTTDTVASYDETPFLSVAFPEVHPNRLSVIASLFGMSPTPVTSCRVLELGCGSASSLIATAAGLPDSQFIGIDLSVNEVKRANDKIKAIGLTNIEVKHGNIMEVNKELGMFDYILAPGIYSWVPAEVREKTLSLCHELLSAQGVAYVNYNAYPGWHLYQSLRDLLLIRIKDIKNVREKIKEARRFTHELADSLIDTDDAFRLFLKQACEEMDTWDDGQLRHDLLGDINQPFYFHEFMSAASKHQLQYLGEAPFQTMILANFAQTQQKIISQAGNDIIMSEQYMDFVRNRPFRETLLCHADIKLNRTILPKIIKQFYLVSQIDPVSPVPNVLSMEGEEFLANDGSALFSDHPLVKALWQYLSIEAPKPVTFKDVVLNVKDELGAGNFVIQEFQEKADAETVLLTYLLQGFSRGYLQLFSYPLPITLQINTHPKTTALIRYDAKHSLQVTNLLHQIVNIDHFAHHILPHLDGTRTIDEVLQILMRDVKSGGIKLDRNGAPIVEEEVIRKVLMDQLMSVLKRAAKTGLLVD